MHLLPDSLLVNLLWFFDIQYYLVGFGRLSFLGSQGYAQFYDATSRIQSDRAYEEIHDLSSDQNILQIPYRWGGTYFKLFIAIGRQSGSTSRTVHKVDAV